MVAFIAAIIFGIAAWACWDDANTHQFLCDYYGNFKNCAREETQRQRAIGLIVGTAIAGAVTISGAIAAIEMDKRLKMLDGPRQA